MRVLVELRERLRVLFSGAREDRELEEELRFHLEMETEANLRRGMAPGEARRAALLKFGGVERYKEEVRDARGVRPLQDFGRDLRQGLRALARRPGFTAVALLTLALGIGATTSIFGIANWLVLRPIPGVVDPDELVLVHMERSPGRSTGLSYPNFVDLRDEVAALSGLAGMTSTGLQGSIPGSSAVYLSGVTVVGDYFGVLGMRPRVGRFFTEAELGPGGSGRVAVISHGLWRSLFGGDDDVVGRTIHLNGHRFDVIGVTPERFGGTNRFRDIQVWLPAPAYALARHRDWELTDRKPGLFMALVGRLGPGATPERAQARLRDAMARLVEAYRPTVYAGVGISPLARGRVRQMLGLLAGIAALVLLVACANTGNLLLFRAAGRRGESAVRRALGASVGRLLQHHLGEALVLGAGGVGLGVLVAAGINSLFESFVLFGRMSVGSVELDPRVLVFVTVLALTAAVAFAVVPTVFAQRLGLVSHLTESARATTGRGARTRSVLVVVQIAAAVGLVATALLLTTTVRNLTGLDLGFDTDRVVAFGVAPAAQGYEEAEVRVLEQRLRQGLEERAGVGRVALASSAPFVGSYALLRLRPGGADPESEPLHAYVFWVSDGFFETLGIPVVSGRAFRPEEASPDADAANDGVILGRTAAERLFGDTDVVGRSVTEEAYRETYTYRVVGVVEDIRATSLREGIEPVAYRPLPERWGDAFMLLARSSGPRALVERAARKVMTAVDPRIPFFRVESLSDGIGRAVAEERLFARLSSLLGLLGAFLAAVGLYGVVAYSVANRRREIGVRMALGADRRRVVGMVARQTGALLVTGAAVGFGAAVAIGRLLESRLFGVTALDPETYVITAAAFAVIGLIAGIAPARSAARVDPVRALRQ